MRVSPVQVRKRLSTDVCEAAVIQISTTTSSTTSSCTCQVWVNQLARRGCWYTGRGAWCWQTTSHMRGTQTSNNQRRGVVGRTGRWCGLMRHEHIVDIKSRQAESRGVFRTSAPRFKECQFAHQAIALERGDCRRVCTIGTTCICVSHLPVACCDGAPHQQGISAVSVENECRFADILGSPKLNTVDEKHRKRATDL